MPKTDYQEPSTPRMSHVPSYMQPTRSSRMKENMYGTEFKFVPKKVMKEPSFSPKTFGMDYIPRVDHQPGVPSFMRQTSTSKGKVAAQAAKPPRARHVHRKKSKKIESISEIRMFTETNVISKKFESILESLSFYQAEKQAAVPAAPVDVERDTIKEKRRKSYSYVTPNPALFANRDGTTSPILSNREAARMKAIQSAPPEDSAHEDSSESQFSTFSPSSRLNGASNRPATIPRYMQPTSSSAARVRQ